MLENSIQTALGSLAAGGCWPLVFPQGASGGVRLWPAIRYTFIDVVPIEDICGDGGADADETADTRLQIDAVATTYDAMRALRLQVMGAMSTFDPPAILQSTQETYDAETKTHRAILDYALYPSSASGNSPP